MLCKLLENIEEYKGTAKLQPIFLIYSLRFVLIKVFRFFFNRSGPGGGVLDQWLGIGVSAAAGFKP